MIHGILLVQFMCLTVQVFFGLPLGLALSTSYSIHFFTQLLSDFCSTCPYHPHCNQYCCSTEIMSSNLSLFLIPSLGTLSWCLMPHIHLTILISALWSATSFSFLTGQVSLPCNILLRTQLSYNLPLTLYDISFTNCLILIQPAPFLHRRQIIDVSLVVFFITGTG